MLIRERGDKTEKRRHRGEGDGKMEGETGVMWLQTNRCQGMSTATRSWKRPERILLYSLQRKHGPANNFALGLLATRAVRKAVLLP